MHSPWPSLLSHSRTAALRVSDWNVIPQLLDGFSPLAEQHQQNAFCSFVTRLGNSLWWFIFGAGLQHAKPTAESGIAHVIAILSIVLAGFVGFAISVHETALDPLPWRTYRMYVLVYLVAGFIALGPLTSILRTTWQQKACDAFRRVWIGEAGEMRHHFSQPTIYLASWTLASCIVMVVGGGVLGFFGWFPGQKPPPTIILPVSSAENHEWSSTSDYHRRPGLIVHVPINSSVLSASIPRRLVLKVSLAPELADKWEIVDSFGLHKSRSHAEQGEFPAVLNTDSPRSDTQTVVIVEMDRNGSYSLIIALVARAQNADWHKAKILIEDKRKLIVTVEYSHSNQ